MTPERRSFLIKQRALALGFEAVGVTNLQPVPHRDELQRWLDAGHAGTMQYMHRQAARRMEPATIVDGARYAVVVTKNYFHAEPAAEPGKARVARYARGRDYHDALRPTLDELAATIRAMGSGSTFAKAYIDAGPVPERELAQRAGLGWIGKNTMLIDPDRGSYCFLASVLTNLELAVDQPFAADRCGTCRRCLDACPTAAFVDSRILDSRRCISYLTIEHRGEIEEDLHGLMDDWVFGCDICQEVCPWNHKFAEPATDRQLAYDAAFAHLEPDAFAAMSSADFTDQYGDTALARPGLEGMRRNAAIASKNIAARCAEAGAGAGAESDR